MKSSLTLASLLAFAAAASAQQITVDKPWVRATVAQQKATGAFFSLRASSDARLVGVSSPAGRAEIHEMAMAKDVMKMREVASLDLAAGKAVELKPGGFHIMLMDLKAPIKAGDSVPLTLTVEGKDGKRQTIEVKAEARQLGAPAHAH